MKKFYTIIAALLISVSGAWAETTTWESREGWTQSSGGVANLYWFGVHTPGNASSVYSFTSLQLMQQTTGSACYLAIARTNSTSTLSADYVVAVSDNAVTPSQSTGKLETYNFSEGVSLLGGTTYYFVFLSSNTLTNGAYTVAQGRVSLNHNGYSDAYSYGNSNGNSAWWPYYKAECESSSATGFCTGDNLGGTTNSGNSSWNNTWTSGTTPSFKISSNANNINKDNANIGGLDIRSGTAKSATYTISAPTGYIITGYKLFGNALNGNQTVTPAEGGSAVVFTSAGNSIRVSGLRKASTSFTLAGANNGLFLHAMQVELEPLTSITTLPTANDKAYVIANAHATFNFADNATAMSVVTPANTNLDAQAQQIALIYKDENYYLFSVNAGKYLTANNTLISMPTDAVNITATGNASYPWFFSFKNVADKNINVTETPSLTIDDYSTIDAGNSNAIIEVADFDATNALQMFNVRNVTYNLSYDGNSTFRTVSDVTVTLSGAASDFVPASFVADGVTLSYSPETITDETTEVVVTATWNGPFQLSDSYASAKWYTVGIHSYYESDNYIWKYDNNKLATESVATDAYYSLSDANCFAFVGNPYDGITIYNKSAGSGVSLTKADDGTQATFDASGSLFIPKASTVSNKTIANGYACFIVKDGTYYLNCNAGDSYNVCGWSAADEGSTCWFIPAGQYYLDYIDGLALEAPVGAVGTSSYFTTVADAAAAKSTLTSLRSTVSGALYSDMATLATVNNQLDPIRSADIIALTDGYYRFVNAYTAWTSTRPTTFYNSTANRIEWSVASNTSDNVNSIFKVNAATPSVFSPNAQKFMSVVNSTVSGSLADEAGTTEFVSLGSAQYNVKIGGGTMHTAGHNSGAGTSGNLTSWGGGYTNTADAWYIVKVQNVDLPLNGPVDGKYYATLCLPFDVTITGATAYTMTDNGTYLKATEVTDNKVPAGTPVLLKGDAATATATINTGEAFNSGAPLDCALTGTYVNIAITGADDYFLGYDATEGVGFYHWAGTELKANRAYLPAGQNSKGFALVFDDDDPTAVASALNGQSSILNGQFYDLQGRKIAAPQKGQLYIVNGKKVLY